MAIVANKATGVTDDKSFVSPNRVTGADPNGVLTPQYVGEIVRDTGTKKNWKAEGLANTDWVPLTTLVSIV